MSLADIQLPRTDAERDAWISSLRLSLAQDSLKEFIHQAWHLVEPTRALVWNWHLDEYCDILQDVYAGKIKRLIVTVPPGTAKSLIFSVFFNAWVWAKDPSKKFLTSSYSDANTIRDNLRLRDIVTSDWYRQSYGVQLSSDQWAKVRFNTTAKGWRIASSVGGVGTGEHPDFIILDDLLKAEDARSEARRDEATSYISSTISTRVAIDPAIIVVGQRLHEDDPPGYLLDKGGWTHVLFPMRYRAKGQPRGYSCACHSYTDPHDSSKRLVLPDSRDHRKVEGELLWPEVWGEQKVQDEELLLGLAASGQLGQDPVPEGGALFLREWFDVVDASEVPHDLDECRGWDIAETESTEKTAKQRDWTVGVKIGRSRSSGLFYVRDVIRVQQTLVGGLIKQTAVADGSKCKVREGAKSGKATTKARSIALAGYDYDTSPENEDKISRANNFRSQCQSRNVKIVRAEWNAVYLSVVCGFPLIKRDDDVDASSNAFNGLVGEEATAKRKVVRSGWRIRRRR